MTDPTIRAEQVPIDRAELEALARLSARPLPRWKQALYVVAVLVGSVLGWEGLARYFGFPQFILPLPSRIVVSLWRHLVTRGDLWFHVGYTAMEVALGFVIGAGVGLVLGIWIALSRVAERVFYPYIVGLQTLPKVAIAPLFIIWLGTGIQARIGIAATIAMFPVVVNTFVGLRNVERDRILFLRSLSATRWQIFIKIQFPSALPLIFAGLDLAIVFSVIGAIVGEMISGIHGLGSVIMQKNYALDTSGIFAVLIILGAMGTGAHSLVRWVQKKVVFWSEEHIIVGT
jgi:NitT/TauT family transport system permease protein